jgi:hypothetical protein
MSFLTDRRRFPPPSIIINYSIYSNRSPGLLFFNPASEGVSVGDGASIFRSAEDQKFSGKIGLFGAFQCKY